MKTTIALAVLFVSLGAAAQSTPYQNAFETGNDLMSKIVNRASDETSFGKALFYVRGVADATSGISQCAPGSVTNGQMMDIVLDLIRQTPTLRHYSAGSYVTHALAEAFPCPKPKSPTKTF